VRARSLPAKIIVYLVLIALSGLFLMPLMWTISTSLKINERTMQLPPEWIPRWQVQVPAKAAHRINGRWAIDPLSDTKPRKVFLATDDGGRALRVVELAQTSGGKVVAILGPQGRVGQVLELSLDRTAGPAEKVARFEPVLEFHLRWCNYADAVMYHSKELGYIPMLRQARNTIYLAALSVTGTVVSNSLIAYAFARLRWRGRDVLFALTLATMMVPFPVTMVAVFSVFKELGWIGSFRPLWVPAWFGSAFNIFLLRQFFLTIPRDLSDAAAIDGCTELQIFRHIILPLSKPALAVVGLFHFMYVWNDFLGPLIYLTNERMFTLSLGLQAYQSQHGGTEWSMLMAASMIVITPLILLFFLTQRTFIQGVRLTGLKG
jgi:multiple sugar transport system permease protein